MLIKQPLTTAKVTLKNRLVLPPMATQSANPDGTLTDQLYDYYNMRAQGGDIGLIITEHSFIAKQGRARMKQPSIAEGCDMSGWKKLAEILKQDGSCAVVQLNHCGSGVSEETGEELIAPSAVLNPSGTGCGIMPREMTIDEIHEIAALFASSALRAKEAGFDGVEIHSAHGYLLNQFYSPLSNHRTDAYGGTLENRIRLHVEVIRAVRAAVGDDYLILLRLGGSDYMEGGSTIADAVEACCLFEKEGVDIIDLSGGMCRYTLTDRKYPGYFRDLSEAVKQAVSIPVILTGGVTELDQGEQLLQAGSADLIGVGRALLKDSDWAKRAMKA